MKKNTIIKVIIATILLILVSFGITYIIISGKIQNIFVKEPTKNEGKSTVSYTLTTPSLPLKDIYDIEYITLTTYELKSSSDDWSYELYINGKKELVIKDNYTNEETIATTVKNVKYIIDKNLILTNDGGLYKHTSKKNIITIDNLSANDIDSFKVFKPENEEVNFTNVFKITAGSDGAGRTIAETSKGTYYNLNNISYLKNEYGDIASTGKSENMHALIKDYALDIISSDYNFNVYYNGKVTCKGNYQNGNQNYKYELDIYNQDGEKVTGYKYLHIRNGNVYFISLENKLYQLNYNNIKYNTKLVATLVNDNAVTTISYDEKKQDSVIFTFSNDETFKITNAIFNRSYNIFLDRED